MDTKQKIYIFLLSIKDRSDGIGITDFEPIVSLHTRVFNVCINVYKVHIYPEYFHSK